jgi:uncharacterized membrane protein
MTRKGWTDAKVDQIIGNLLRAGVVTAAFVVLLGGTAYLMGHGAASLDARTFRGEPLNLRSARSILRGTFSGGTREVIQFGILLLIATPVARVAFSVVAFARQRDRTYVIVTLIVFVLLCYSMTGAGS